MGAQGPGIAIVGMACRFPGGADHPHAFWTLLRSGFNAITEVPPARPELLRIFDPDPKKPARTYSKWGGFLDHIDLFDAPFFGISPREARHMDPQHRLLLELVWEACEDAGLPPSRLVRSDTGVFAGISTHDYGDALGYPRNQGEIGRHTATGVARNIAANRISYFFDFRGPSIAVDTACSSALTAVHLACRSVLDGDCSLAVAGGVQILLSAGPSIAFAKASMLSPTGQCRAFDAEADGYVRSEGGGVVLLKLLDAALADGDPIYSVIRATAVNQDGRTKGITVPSGEAQQALMEQALRRAGVAPAEVQYVEAHGTGTLVGDPIEAAAIGTVMSRGRPEGSCCVMGSVKTNLGHTEPASGIAALIKTALAIRHGEIPASLHFQRPNPAIDFTVLRLRVPTGPEPWPHPEQPRIAAVNSFGFGGANALVLLGEAPARAPAPPEVERPRLLVLSAKDPQALSDLAARYATQIRAGTASLRDVCYSASERRAHLKHRLAIVATRRDEFVELLTDFVADKERGQGANRANVSSGKASRETPKLAFVFAGINSQWWGMGRQLRASEPVFCRALERCDAALRPLAGWSLLEELDAEESSSRLALPEFVHVAHFAFQVALAELWISRGIAPDSVLGHGSGAVAAAYIAGVYPLEDAIGLAFHRSRFLARPEVEGKMLAVGAGFDEVAALVNGCEEQVSLAAINGPASIILSGDAAALERIHAALLERHIFARFLPVTAAEHSPLIERIGDEFAAAIENLRGRASGIPLISDMKGAPIDGAACDAQYWTAAMRRPVLFRDGMRELLGFGISCFVEISPQLALLHSIQECLKEFGREGVAISPVLRAQDEQAALLRSLGRLFTLGFQPAWHAIREEGAQFTPLPLYPWRRERHWFESSAHVAELDSREDSANERLPAGEPGPMAHPAPSGDGQPAAASLRRILEQEDAEGRIRRIEQYLLEQIARLLGAAASSVEMDQPLTDLGLDSLIAAELATVLERDLSVQIAGHQLLSGPTIRGLAREILTMLKLESAAPEPVAEAEPTPQPALIHRNGASPKVDYGSLDFSSWTLRQKAVRVIATAGFRCIARVDAQGLENIPPEGPSLLAVNHISMADTPLLLTLFRRRTITYAVDLLKQFPALDWFLSDLGQAIYIKRNHLDPESIEQGLAVLRAGGQLAISPEGIRSKTGLLRGRTGIALIAAQSGVPVIPVAAWGQERWRERLKQAGRIPVYVRAGQAIPFPRGTPSPAQLREHTDLIMSRIAALLPPEYRGVYAADDGAQ